MGKGKTGFSRFFAVCYFRRFSFGKESVREKFDVILLDPPYEAGLLEPAISHIAKFDILAPHGIIVAEHPVGRAVPALAAPYRLHRTYRYGKIAMTLYRRGANEENEE